MIVVDDGLATGSTMLAAVLAIKQKGPRRIVVAVPVAAPQACAEFEAEADETLCLRTPQPFQAVGLWYENFEQVSDPEVIDLLKKAEAREPGVKAGHA